MGIPTRKRRIKGHDRFALHMSMLLGGIAVAVLVALFFPVGVVNR